MNKIIPNETQNSIVCPHERNEDGVYLCMSSQFIIDVKKILGIPYLNINGSCGSEYLNCERYIKTIMEKLKI